MLQGGREGGGRGGGREGGGRGGKGVSERVSGWVGE